MKIKNIFLIAAVAVIMAGCGGGSPETQNQTKALAVQAAPTIQGFSAEQLNTVVTRSQTRMSMAAQREPSTSIQGYRTNYTITVDDGSVSILNNITKETTNFGKITSLRFVDKWISFDDAGPESQVFRLYQAAFNRKPDVGGLGFWIKAFKDGHTLQDIANGFVNSDEFKRMYGEAPTNEVIIGKYYNNVLHRDAEKGGFDWWVQALKNGALRNEVLTGFSESDENKKNLKPTLIAGFEYIPFQEDTPIAVKNTSYNNAKSLAATQSIPVEAGGMPQDGFAFFHAYGFADFFQDKTQSMITVSNEYLADKNATKDNAKTGHIKFWKKDEKGTWIDHTKDLLADDTGCVLARKVVVADFNGDGKPDVFLSCHGYDAPPFPGERQRIILSQANGTYKNNLLDINCFCHGAAAADFDNNGYADIVVADFLEGKGAYFLKNNKDGTFTVDTTRLPDSVKNKGAIFSAEIVDLNGDGKLDVWLAGNEKDWPTTVFMNDGTNSFSKAKQVVLPADSTFGAPLDIAVSGNFAYILRSNSDVSGAEIQKLDLTTMQASIIYTNTNYYPTQPLKWVDWITVSNGYLVSVNSVFGINIKL